MDFKRAQKLVVLSLFLGFSIPGIAAADSLGQREEFFIDPEFDALKRDKVSATLRKITDQMYFYIEDEWWNSLNGSKRNETLGNLGGAAEVFEKTAYSRLVGLFGSENKPGLDQDEHIVVLVHRTGKRIGGYVRTADGYTTFETPSSNEREMFYIGTERIESPHLASFFAHEFTHLIQFNQKELKHGVTEDVWIQEGLAEVAPTLAGLDDPFEESYLEKRVQDFLSNPRDPLTEWRNVPSDYGVASLFFHYLNDQYGEEVLRDIMWSPLKGIAAIDDGLNKNGHATTFSRVFTDWTVAVFANECSLGERYCYKNENLRNVRVVAFTSFLSPFGDSELRVTNQTKVWTGNWNKISGSQGKLQLNFAGHSAVTFQVPYLLQKPGGEYELGFFSLNTQQNGGIEIPGFGEKYSAVVILPAIHGNIRSLSSEPSFFFTWTGMTSQNGGNEEPGTSPEIAQLLVRIEELRQQVAFLQAQLAVARGGTACQAFNRDLSFGMTADPAVSCLQQVLKDQGPGVYPEGLVTGNFLGLTRQAVIRFQERYASDILAPFGLQEGTGYVGQKTRQKLNQLLSESFS